jgi:hypothetical protein
MTAGALSVSRYRQALRMYLYPLPYREPYAAETCQSICGSITSTADHIARSQGKLSPWYKSSGHCNTAFEDQV